MSVAIGSKLHNTYRFVCFCQFVYFLHQYYFELWQFSDFHSGHLFLNSRRRPDTLSVVIDTKFHIKLYITRYMCANFRAFVISIF